MKTYKHADIDYETFETFEIDTEFSKDIVESISKKISELPYITTPAIMHKDDTSIIKFGIADRNDRNLKGTMKKYSLELKIDNIEEDPNEQT